jgi:hypothetical protein
MTCEYICVHFKSVIYCVRLLKICLVFHAYVFQNIKRFVFLKKESYCIKSYYSIF